MYVIFDAVAKRRHVYESIIFYLFILGFNEVPQSYKFSWPFFSLPVSGILKQKGSANEKKEAAAEYKKNQSCKYTPQGRVLIIWPKISRNLILLTVSMGPTLFFLCCIGRLMPRCIFYFFKFKLVFRFILKINFNK